MTTATLREPLIVGDATASEVEMTPDVLTLPAGISVRDAKAVVDAWMSQQPSYEFEHISFQGEMSAETYEYLLRYVVSAASCRRSGSRDSEQIQTTMVANLQRFLAEGTATLNEFAKPADRIVIVAGGPSIRDVDWDLLRDRDVKLDAIPDGLPVIAGMVASPKRVPASSRVCWVRTMAQVRIRAIPAYMPAVPEVASVLALAVRAAMLCRPTRIILIAADMALDGGGRMYANHSNHEVNGIHTFTELETAEAIGDPTQQVSVTRELRVARNDLERIVMERELLHEGVEFINATSRGAKIEKWDHMPLADALSDRVLLPSVWR